MEGKTIKQLSEEYTSSDTTPPLEEGKQFFDRASGETAKILGMYVDEDGDTQIRIKDGNRKITLTPQDIRKRLKDGELVSIDDISKRQKRKLDKEV